MPISWQKKLTGNLIFLMKSNANRRSAKNMETELKGAVRCLEEKSKSLEQ